MKNPIPTSVAKVRRDITSYLFHFVNRDADPADTLRQILKGGHIKGGIYPPSSSNTVCFTEAPLAEIVREDGILDSHGYKRLSLWGIGFSKDFIFKAGGLPVIYQPRKLFKDLPESAQWRHVDFDLGTGLDFTWQREWRVQANEFKFEATDAILVIPDVGQFVRELWQIHIDVDVEDGEQTFYGGTFKKWDFIPITHADYSNDSDIEVCRGDDFQDIIQDGYYDKMDAIGP